jgi:hypothetical protein
VAWLLEGVVVVTAARGHFEQVARLYSAIEQLRNEGSSTPVERAWPPYAHAVAAARQAMEPAVWERAATVSDVWTPATAATAGLAALA